MLKIIIDFSVCFSWLLYEKPDFQGRTVALEEGVLELSNLWNDPEQQIEAQSDKPVLIGSIRLVVCVSGIKCFVFRKLLNILQCLSPSL